MKALTIGITFKSDTADHHTEELLFVMHAKFDLQKVAPEALSHTSK